MTRLIVLIALTAMGAMAGTLTEQLRVFCETNGYPAGAYSLVSVRGEIICVANYTNLPAITTNDLASIVVEPEPTVFTNGIETAVVILQSHTNDLGIGIVADDSGDIITYVDHQSPRPDAATIDQRIRDARQARTTLRQEARSVRTNVVDSLNAMQATSALTNGFTASQNRQLVNDLRRELINTQQELRDLAGIVRQMLKDQSP